ncbi:hypothetical protein BH10ACI1_BH10ACI1_07350 [soil metagenome]
MRKINLSRISLLTGLLLTGISVFAQGGSEIGVTGPMRGRIINTSGSGIRGAVITVIPVGSCFQWAGTFAKSNSNGYYFLRVHYDCSLIVSVSKQGMNFTPDSMFVSIDGNYENVNFVGNRIPLRVDALSP